VPTPAATSSATRFVAMRASDPTEGSEKKQASDGRLVLLKAGSDWRLFCFAAERLLKESAQAVDRLGAQIYVCGPSMAHF
jgi:hypothetical protein